MALELTYSLIVIIFTVCSVYWVYKASGNVTALDLFMMFLAGVVWPLSLIGVVAYLLAIGIARLDKIMLFKK